jgi:hypothetical protein
MPPDPSLPQRRAGGYQITSIVLEITAGGQLVERINRAVQMPAPPAGNLNEMELAALLTRLAPLASQALQILQEREGGKARNSYAKAQYERVQIRVLSGGRLVGRVNGARQTFNPRGQMTSAGDRLRVDTSPRTEPKKRGGDPKGNGRKS